MMDAVAFITSMQGKPWTVEEHCWSLTRLAQIECFGIEVPDILLTERLDALALVRKFRDHPERARWRQVSQPSHGAIVLMNKGGPHGRAIHAGTYFDTEGGGILHVDDPHGVVFEDTITIQLRGWTCEYYIFR